MKDLNIKKIIIAAAAGIAVTFAFTRISDIPVHNVLTVVAAATILWSFTFLHTMMGDAAARSGSPYNQYSRIRGNMKYNIREESGIIKETLIVGIAELLVSILLYYL